MRIGGKSQVKLKWTAFHRTDKSALFVRLLFTLVLPITTIVLQQVNDKDTKNADDDQTSMWLGIFVLVLNVLLYVSGLLKKTTNYWAMRCVEWRAEAALDGGASIDQYL